jgi:hypothetical protein
VGALGAAGIGEGHGPIYDLVERVRKAVDGKGGGASSIAGGARSPRSPIGGTIQVLFALWHRSRAETQPDEQGDEPGALPGEPAAGRPRLPATASS